VTVEWLDDPTAFVASDWTPLVAADPDATFFHSPRYLKLYWEEFGAEALRIALVQRGGEPVAAAAFDLRGSALTWLGGFDVTDYMGPVGFPEAREAAAKELMGAVASRDDWEDADLAGLPSWSGWLTALRAAAEDAGLSADVEPDAVAPFLRLPPSYDAYLGGLSPKLRHEIRRKERRLREAFPAVELVDSTPDRAPDDLDRFVDMHRSSPGEKGRFMVPRMELFFRRLVDELLPDGAVRLAFLEADGQKLAGAVGFRDGDRFLLYNSSYDHRFASVSPGLVLLAHLIAAVIDEGRTGFDMLKGDLPYKYRYGARGRRISRLRLRRR
jgi:CelD/BcsL family acetyltransferase involved in cellulose biosynthesis